MKSITQKMEPIKQRSKGDLTIHGETKEVEAEGKFIVKGGKITAEADFSVKLSDFKISIPGLVADKIAKTAKNHCFLCA